MRRMLLSSVFVVACSAPPPGVDGGSAGGSTAGGTTAGGSTAGGSTAGGSTAGGSTAGGSTAGGSTAGGSTAGGSTAGGSTAGGSTAGGSTAGGSTAGGSTAGGSTAGGSTAGGTAGGSSSDGGIANDCDFWGSAAAHLQRVLMNCSDPSDVNIYGFNRSKCVAQAATACTLADRDMLTRISTCDLQINPCVTTSDRTAAVGAINACVGMGTSLSSGCIGAIQ